VAATALAAPLPAAAQPPRMPRVVVLRPTSASNPYTESFRQGMRELGWIEGTNIQIDFRFSDGLVERLPGLAAEVVALKPDVILTDGPAIPAVRRVTSTIPVVFAITGDAVGEGYASSLARPGGNLTGFSVMAPEVDGKRLELVRTLMPQARRIAVIWNPHRPVHQVQVRTLQSAAGPLGVEVVPLEVRAPTDFEPAFAALVRERCGAAIVFDEAMFFNERARIAELALKHRVPALYGNRGFAEAGGLLSYGPSLHDLFRRAAGKVDRILRGANPAEIPVEQPTTFELVLNARTASALGLTFPQSVLVRADDILR
jgi:putative ABC transport system substrate-binding protein